MAGGRNPGQPSRLMKLSELIKPFNEANTRGNLNEEVMGLTDDSRQVKPGTLFIAVRGTKSDGHQYLKQAAAAGAVGLVVQSGQGDVKVSFGALPVIEVPDSRHFL